MSYLTIIPLVDAKVYLRVDDTLTEDDDHITRMINSAFEYIERWTNVLVFSRINTYRTTNGKAYVYDAPINTGVGDPDREEKGTYSIYTTTDETFTLSVGYGHYLGVPNDLTSVAYEIIDLLYYQHETGKKLDKDLSDLSKSILNKHKRFIL